MHASVHDRIVILSPHLDEPSRDGEILEVRGAEGAPPYQVRWSDTGHEGLYFPGTDAVIHHAQPEPPHTDDIAPRPEVASVVRTDADALSDMYALDAGAVEALRWEPVADCAGVDQKVLWRLGDFVQALVRYAPGATTPGVAHLAAHHHIWIVAGTMIIAGRTLGAGSYMHVPPGAAHTATSGEQGCTMLQMHRPHPANGMTPSTR